MPLSDFTLLKFGKMTFLHLFDMTNLILLLLAENKDQTSGAGNK